MPHLCLVQQCLRLLQGLLGGYLLRQLGLLNDGQGRAVSGLGFAGLKLQPIFCSDLLCQAGLAMSTISDVTALYLQSSSLRCQHGAVGLLRSLGGLLARVSQDKQCPTCDWSSNNVSVEFLSLYCD